MKAGDAITSRPLIEVGILGVLFILWTGMLCPFTEHGN
jgi:hypothetical protein